MRFWPFGKEEKEASEVEFASRVVTGSARDGAQLRAKLTVSFSNPLTQAEADDIADIVAGHLREAFVTSTSATSVLAREADLGAECLAASGALSSIVRAIEVVALHIVGDADAASRRASTRPPAEAAPANASSRPPPPANRRPASSSQMLAVRDSRLIPEGATPEAAGVAIVPLLRDAATRVLVGILRGYDLLIVRGVELEGTSPDQLGELVPVSVAAPGRFADDRRPELARWHDKLGEETLAALRGESSAVVCFFLHMSLERAGVDMSSSTALLEAAARNAFSEDAPLAALPRYLGAADPTDTVAMKSLAILGGASSLLASFSVVLTPVLASLQADFAFTSSQIKISLAP